MKRFPTQDIPIDSIDRRPGNPNKMAARERQDLRYGLDTAGMLQPILVVPKSGGRYELIDGEHRLDEVIALGEHTIPATIAQLGSSQVEDFLAQRVRMNKVRGSLDLTEVAATAAELAQSGWSEELISKGIGFTEEEVGDLLDMASTTADKLAGELGRGAAAAAEQLEDEAAEEAAAEDEVFALEVHFRTQKDLVAAKRKLGAALKKQGKKTPLDFGDALLLSLR